MVKNTKKNSINHCFMYIMSLISEVEGRFASISSCGASQNSLSPLGPSLVSYITQPEDFVALCYRECGKMEFVSHYVSIALQKLDAVSICNEEERHQIAFQTCDPSARETESTAFETLSRPPEKN
jgi:hypothetical protein